MKIVNVNHSVDAVTGGGTAERTLQLSKHLVNLGHTVTMMTFQSDEDARLAPAGIEHLEVRSIGTRYPLPLPRLSKLLQVCREADIILLMGHWSILNSLVAWAATKTGTPYVHCPAGSATIQGRSRLVKKVYNVLSGRRIFERASRIISITEKETGQLVADGIDEKRISVIPNGVTLEPGERADSWSRKDVTRPYLLFLGRLNWIKGPDLLLSAFDRTEFPTFDLVFAGPDGGLLNQLRTEAATSRHASRISFVGPVRGADKARLLAQAEALVVPSRSEAMSIVALEAGLRATPVVLTDVCGFDEVAEVGGGWVVQPDIAGLAAGLDQLSRASGELPSMGKKLQALVHKKYMWEGIAQRHVEVFASVLQQTARQSTM